MQKPKPNAGTILEAMAVTFRERNAIYGDNFLRIGNAMHALFPQGLNVETPEEWTRLYFLLMKVVKSSRYATNFKKGGHRDSVHDSAVYAALLEAYDERIADKQVGARHKHKARNAPHGAQADGKQPGAKRR